MPRIYVLQNLSILRYYVSASVYREILAIMSLLVFIHTGRKEIKFQIKYQLVTISRIPESINGKKPKLRQSGQSMKSLGHEI